MQYIKGLEAYQNTRKTAITLGKFDGLHLGHEMLVDRVVLHQQKEDVDSVVFAFDMAELYQRRKMDPGVLMTNRERVKRLEGRVDYLLECPFTESICGMEAEDFIRDILVSKFHARYVVVGSDFHFGYQKRGDYHMLEKFSEIYDFELEVLEKKCFHEREISSTFIREELKKGNMELVNEILGYPYEITGMVMHGRKLGRTIGIPTMNVRPEDRKILPPYGVYVASILIDGKWYQGVCNIGVKPTVEEDSETLLEAHVFGINADTYGTEVSVCLQSYVRREQKFSTVDELKKRMQKDIECAKKYFDSISNV